MSKNAAHIRLIFEPVFGGMGVKELLSTWIPAWVVKDLGEVSLYMQIDTSSSLRHISHMQPRTCQGYYRSCDRNRSIYSTFASFLIKIDTFSKNAFGSWSCSIFMSTRWFLHVMKAFLYSFWSIFCRIPARTNALGYMVSILPRGIWSTSAHF